MRVAHKATATAIRATVRDRRYSSKIRDKSRRAFYSPRRMEHELARRPLKSRSANWPRQIAFALVRKGFTPNQISVASLMFSLTSGTCLWLSPSQSRPLASLLFIAAAICIQLRLVCNLLDGLMAVEGGKKAKAGEIFNEFPDRIADVVLFVCTGYCIYFLPYGIQLGWACAVGAVLTAYVRVFGGAVGLPQDFCGPMAKQQRMAVLTAGCILSAVERFLGWTPRILFIALCVVLIGSLITAGRRTLRIARLLNQR
jgi:phosphatidylglycerophosphate synthase